MTKQTLPFASWLAQANAALLSGYAIVFIKDSACVSWIGDSGADEDDMRRLYDSGDTPKEAADWWAEKYDLDSTELHDADTWAKMAADYLAKVEAPAHG